jgi:large subunit ribosomal protein L9
MAKINVILTHNVVGLGGESDQVKVAAGYARNFLLPQSLAIPVTRANKRQLEVLQKRRTERETHDLSSMAELAKSLSKLITVVVVKTGDDGKMFGSVTSLTIVEAFKTQFDITLDKKKVHLTEPIRSLGDHEVEMRLHPEVHCSVTVRVESSTPLPPAEPEPVAEEAKPARGKKA